VQQAKKGTSDLHSRASGYVLRMKATDRGFPGDGRGDRAFESHDVRTTVGDARAAAAFASLSMVRRC